ncbi:retrovirus-related pol polyprotein from transposon TNT 1-94 [Tanacetum coccineum]
MQHSGGGLSFRMFKGDRIRIRIRGMLLGEMVMLAMGAQNRAGNANAGQGKQVKCYNCNRVGHIARNCTQPKRPQNSNYFKDKMLLMQAQENGAVLDKEELLFLAADECDAFDSNVDNEPTAQTIFMANLSSAGSVNPQAGPSNASILSEVVQIVLWYLDSGCSKHMTGDRSRLRNFVKKFIGTVRFRNDHFGAIMGYGDYVIGDSVISRVYYVEGLGHNLFSVGQFCDSDLEVAFRKHTCFVRDLDDLTDYYESVGITHEKTVPRTPQQNGVVERRNRTLVEAARTMLIFSKAPLFLWAEAVATAYLAKWKAKADIRFFVGYAPNRKGYKIYNKRTRQIMETIHVTFNELTEQMAPVHSSSRPAPNLLKHGPISSGLVPNFAPAIPHSPSSSARQSSSVHHDVAAEHSFEVNLFAASEHEPFVNVFAPDPNSEASSFGVIRITAPNQSTQPHEHPWKWTDSHPLDNIIGNPSRPVSTRKQLATDALWCFYNSVLSKVEQKNFKSDVTEDCWFQAMQDEIHEFDRLDVWELVPPPDCAMIIALKWIDKVNLTEYGCRVEKQGTFL